MTEQSALDLYGLSDNNKFIETWEAGDQTFPIMVSVKLVRSFHDVDGVSQPAQGQGKQLTKLKIVQASDQPFDESPTQATVNLIHLLRDTSNDTSCILPAALRMIKESACYVFQVTCPTSSGGADLLTHCQKVVALAQSTQNSKAEAIGDSGFKVITEHVKCVMASDDKHLAAEHTLSATCAMSNLPTYRLDPARGKNQHALVAITSKVDDAFVVEQVQLLNAESAEQAKESLKRLLFLATHVHVRDAKRPIIWTKMSRLGPQRHGRAC
jgi:hypothetical protein